MSPDESQRLRRDLDAVKQGLDSVERSQLRMAADISEMRRLEYPVVDFEDRREQHGRMIFTVTDQQRRLMLLRVDRDHQNAVERHLLQTWAGKLAAGALLLFAAISALAGVIEITRVFPPGH